MLYGTAFSPSIASVTAMPFFGGRQFAETTVCHFSGQFTASTKYPVLSLYAQLCQRLRQEKIENEASGCTI